MNNKFSANPRKIPKQGRAKRTVESILVAAAHILAKEGCDAVNTNRIAELAGISIGSLYQYFPCKEAIMTALIERHALKMMDLVETILLKDKDQRFKETVEKLVKESIRVAKTDEHLHHLEFDQIPDAFHLEQVSTTKRYIKSAIQDYFETKKNEVQTNDFDLTAFIFFNTLVTSVHEVATDKSNYLGHKQLEAELTNLMLNYVMAHPD